MLPKPEKIKKKNTDQSVEQTESVSPEQKLKHKRRFVVGVLIVTVGLSICFSVYTFVRRVVAQPPVIKLNMSSLSLNPKVVLPLRSDIKKDVVEILGKDAGRWLILSQTVPSSGSFYWPESKNNAFFDININTLISDLGKQKAGPSAISSELPPGATVRQMLLSQGDINEWRYLISVPQKQILMVFRYTGPVKSADILLPKLAEKLYWYSLNGQD